jgi:hypothetical protein
MSESHTFLGQWGERFEVMVEEFVNDDGTRTINVAFRPLPYKVAFSVWGPPVRMEQTS